MREDLRQVIKYMMTGGMTTVVNYLIFFCLSGGDINYLAANTVAWTGAVLFAYGANRSYVFQSKGSLLKELSAFVLLRVFTLIFENLLLFCLVDLASASVLLSKISVSVVTVILNYFACRYHVFTKGGTEHE